MRRFYQEMLPALACSQFSVCSMETLDKCGIVSWHRVVDNEDAGKFRSQSLGDELPLTLHSFLSMRDVVIAKTMLRYSALKMFRAAETPQAFMGALENLGHASSPFLDGLNVELLPFQRQTLQWATERETCPGGVNSFTWAKLPASPGGQPELYYNPGLAQVSKTKPPLVRGGIIAEEMGLVCAHLPFFMLRLLTSFVRLGSLPLIPRCYRVKL